MTLSEYDYFLTAIRDKDPIESLFNEYNNKRLALKKAEESKIKLQKTRKKIRINLDLLQMS